MSTLNITSRIGIVVADHAYPMFIFLYRNMFDFEHIKPFTKAFASDPGPMVLLASPGMLHAGKQRSCEPYSDQTSINS